MANFKAILLSLALILAPYVTYGADRCTPFTDFSPRVLERIDTRESQFKRSVTDHLARIREQEQSEDGKLFAARKAEDARIASRIQTLSRRAVTSEDRAAVLLFSRQVTDALQARRGATDDALLLFRSSLRAVITAREEKALDATEALRTEVNASLERAIRSCGENRALDSVRDVLRADLARSRADFTVDVAALEEGSTSLVPLRDTRNASLARANDMYRTAITAAHETLRASVSFSTDLSE